MSEGTYKKETLRARVWKWPGPMGWYFITCDKRKSAQIRTQYGKGLLPIEITHKKTTWKTSLLPHTASQGYLIALKAQIRAKENIKEGDIISVQYRIL